jgi:hypothetical protein
MDIAAFPLIWRWTQPSHALLPADVLKALQPVSSAQIESLCESASKSWGPQIIQHRATSDSAETGRWLASLHPPTGRVIAVWNRNTALSLPWETFITYWSDFCYPSSDDVDVFVEGGPLVLRWRHDETFEYVGDSL